MKLGFTQDKKLQYVDDDSDQEPYSSNNKKDPLKMSILDQFKIDLRSEETYNSIKEKEEILEDRTEYSKNESFINRSGDFLIDIFIKNNDQVRKDYLEKLKKLKILKD